MKQPLNFIQTHCNRDYQEFAPHVERIGAPGKEDTFYSLRINSGLSVILSLPRLLELNSVLSAAAEQYKNDSPEPVSEVAA